jgi:hypothetical protein
MTRNAWTALVMVGLFAAAPALGQSSESQIKALRQEMSELRQQLLEIQHQLRNLKSQNTKQSESIKAAGHSTTMKQWLGARSRLASEHSAFKQQKLRVKRTEVSLKHTVATQSKKVEAKQAAADKVASATKKPVAYNAPAQKVGHRNRNAYRSYPYASRGMFHGRILYGPGGYRYVYPYGYTPYPYGYTGHHSHTTTSGFSVRYNDSKWSIKAKF